MNEQNVIMKGNEALAEAAIRAGCRFFSGYPITPQTEILEYLSWRMAEVGGDFVQTEDELAAINMLLGASAAGARALTTSSGPGFSLKQEGLSYLAAADLPAVIADVARLGNGLGEIFQSQGDYSLITKGNGHGDSMLIALTPSSVQETVDFTVLAFDLADKYRHPVLILSDAAIGQTMESITLPPLREHDIDTYDWPLRGHKKADPLKRVANIAYSMPGGFNEYQEYLKAKYALITENEQRWESVSVADAELVIVAYGISARVCKEAVKIARQSGLRLGLIRPKAVTPFPVKAFAEIGPACQGLLIVEMSIMGQMQDDVALAVNCRLPVYGYCTSCDVPDSEAVVALAKDILAGKTTPLRPVKEV